MINHERDIYKEAIRDLMPNFERVRRSAKNARTSESTRMPHWLLPVVGAVCAGVVVCSAVPPVRAALVDFFSGSTAYVSTPAQERPEIENVHVQKVDAQTETQWKVRSYAGAEFPWKDQITSVQVEEALYDGSELTLKYSVSAPEMDLAYADDPDLIFGAPQKDFPCVVGSRVFEHPEQIAIIEDIPIEEELEYVAPYEYVHHGERTVGSAADGRITLTSVFDIGEVSPEDDLVLWVACANATRPESGSLSFEYLGYLEVPLHLDLSAPSVKRAAPQTATVDGMPVEITEAVLRPTGLFVDFGLPLTAWAEDLDFNVYADGALMTPGKGYGRVSFLDYLYGSQGGPLEGRLIVPFADAELSTVRLVPINRQTGATYEQDAIELHFEAAQ